MCLKRYLSNSGSSGLTHCKEIMTEKWLESSHNNHPNRFQCEGNKDSSCCFLRSNQKGIGANRDNESCNTAHELFHILGRNDELTKQIELALGSIHEKTATAQFLVTVAKKWGAYLKGNLECPESFVTGRGHVSSSGGEDAASGTNNIKTNEDVNEQMKTFNEILEEEIRFSADLNEMNKKTATISWDVIGGLNDIKKELKKILEWPIKVIGKLYTGKDFPL